MGKQGPERRSSYPKATQQMFSKIRKPYVRTASHPATNTLLLLLEPWSFPWSCLVPMSYMSTILGEATASPRPPVGGEREEWLLLFRGLCAEGILKPALLLCAPGAKGRRAGRQAVHTFYGWATSQNSKQRGRQLAPEPSRE